MKAIFILLSVLLFSGSVSCQNKEPERMAIFNDYGIHINETGQGRPAVIIEAGLGSGLDDYDTLQTAISKFTRVLSYDRPGIGKSAKSPNPRTLPFYVDELRLLRQKENIRSPYILVGHSLGGLIIRYYAYQFPKEVAGLVLIDCIPEGWLEYFRTTHSDEEVKMLNKVTDPGQYTG
ncbi:MAG: alpha/beta hydrolase, partial [Calditrichia bacterium]